MTDRGFLGIKCMCVSDISGTRNICGFRIYKDIEGKKILKLFVPFPSSNLPKASNSNLSINCIS